MAMGRNRLIIGAALGLAVIFVGILLWRANANQELKDKGLAQAKKGDFVEAEPTLRAALERLPSDVEILRALAKGYLATDRKGDADEMLTRMLKIAPDDTEALRLQLDLYRLLGKLDEALANADRLVELEPGNLAWLSKRGELRYLASRFDDAAADFELCRKKASQERLYARWLAIVKEAQGKPAEAAALLDGILRDAPNDAPTLRTRALLHYNQYEYEKSILLFRKMLELNLNATLKRDARYNLSLALSRVGQKEEAARLMEEVRSLQEVEVLHKDSVGQPKNLPLQMRYARAQFEVGAFEPQALEGAAQTLRHILTIDSSHAPAHALMAEVLRAKDKR